MCRRPSPKRRPNEGRPQSNLELLELTDGAGQSPQHWPEWFRWALVGVVVSVDCFGGDTFATEQAWGTTHVSDDEHVTGRLCGQVRAAEARLRNGDPRAFVVDIASSPDRLVTRSEEGRLVSSDACPATGRMVCVSNDPSRPSVVAWDDECAGPFIPEWVRLVGANCSADLSDDGRILTVSATPNLRIIQSIGEALAIPGLYTLGNGSLASIFSHAEVSQTAVGSACHIMSRWGDASARSSLEVTTPCATWRPDWMRYDDGHWWVDLRLEWEPALDCPARWTRTSGELGGLAQSALRFQATVLSETMLASVNAKLLTSAIGTAVRIVDIRADTTLDYGTSAAWILGVCGTVIARPSDPLRIPWELPRLVQSGIPNALSPSSASERPAGGVGPSGQTSSHPRKVEFTRCDLGGVGVVTLATVAASTLPQSLRFKCPLANPTDRDVRIVRTVATCGCLSTQVSSDSISPGGEVWVEGTLALVLPKDKRERISIITDDGKISTIEVVVAVDLSVAMRLATPVLTLNATGVETAVFLARTQSAEPPQRPSVDPTPGIQVGQVLEWQLLLSDPAKGVHVWWGALELRRTAAVDRTIILRAMAPGLDVPLQILPGIPDPE